MIAIVWLISCIVMIPTAICQRLLALPSGAHKCTETWDNKVLEKVYTVVLDVLLLLAPLCLMLAAYGQISYTLYKGMRLEMRSAQELQELRRSAGVSGGDEVDTDDERHFGNGVVSNGNHGKRSVSSSFVCRRTEIQRHQLRHTNTERQLQAKRRVVRMLFVVVLEFFLCWTPVYVLQTWLVLDFEGAVQHVSPMTMNMFHLLSYASSCCNPITYCFMNRRFRQGFFMAFGCCRQRWRNEWREPSTTMGGATQRSLGHHTHLLLRSYPEDSAADEKNLKQSGAATATAAAYKPSRT